MRKPHRIELLILDDLAPHGAGVWIEYDFGAAVTVGWLGIAWHEGNHRVASFGVQTSLDGASWSTAIGDGRAAEPC